MGAKEYKKPWPIRRPVWTLGAFFLSGVFFFGVFCLDYWHGWTAAERLYLMDYLMSGVRGKTSAKMTGKYTLLEGVDAKGQQQLILGDEIEPTTGPDGKLAYRLTDEGVKDGLVRLQFVSGTYNEHALHALLGRWVFRHDDIWGYVARPFYFTLAFFALALFLSVPKDRARRRMWEHGRRLRGPELVTYGGVQHQAGTRERAAGASAGRGRVHQRRAELVRPNLP